MINLSKNDNARQSPLCNICFRFIIFCMCFLMFFLYYYSIKLNYFNSFCISYLYTDTYIPAVTDRPENDGITTTAWIPRSNRTSSGFSVVPIFCTLLGLVIFGLLAYVIFKKWSFKKMKLRQTQKMTRLVVSSRTYEKSCYKRRSFLSIRCSLKFHGCFNTSQISFCDSYDIQN